MLGFTTLQYGLAVVAGVLLGYQIHNAAAAVRRKMQLDAYLLRLKGASLEQLAYYWGVSNEKGRRYIRAEILRRRKPLLEVITERTSNP